MAWIRRELSGLGIHPLKRFGQHFLIDESVREELVEQAALTISDTVLEIGSGLGFLTVGLAARAGQVIAVEKDRTLALYLKNRFHDCRNLTVIQGDALDIKIPDDAKIVSSPPYNISSKLVLLLLESRFKLASLLLQHEFAKRLVAFSGSPAYGRLTVMLQCRAHADITRKVPRSAFYPKPRVDSALVTIVPIKENPPIRDKVLFVDFVRVLFTQRRRRLRGVLTRYLTGRYSNHAKAILQHLSIPEKRVFEVNPRELMNLSNQIAETAFELKIHSDSLGD